MSKVFISFTDFMTQDMFVQRGWEVVKDPKDADLICLTGGPDVNPNLYGHSVHELTRYNYSRDMYEKSLYGEFETEIPMVGICRGGQLLNVMNGGVLYQHVNNHGHTNHKAQDNNGDIWEVTSDHHQMMIPQMNDGEPFLHCVGVSTQRELWDADTNTFHDKYSQTMPDIEGVWYEDTGCMCFQPHPEWVAKDHDCQVVFFKYLKMFTGM